MIEWKWGTEEYNLIETNQQSVKMADAQGAAAQEEVKHDVEYANEEGKETVSSFLTYESQLGYNADELGT